MKLSTAFVVGVASTFVGRAAWSWYKQNRGVVIPKTQAALEKAYAVGTQAVQAQVDALRLGAHVVTGVVKDRPSILVQVPPGADVKMIASKLPSAAAGLPVNVVA